MVMVGRSRQDSDFGLILPLSMPKSLILSAKGSGFGSYTLEIAKEKVRQGFGLGGQARSGSDGTGAGGGTA
ncbi:MAG: hypothetical protein KA122_09795 [Verrucomicrobia bacterium]|nr:hypothetical protein [Verrucomicrobiota bacterium]HNR71828.1 hypothetical protein [Verrucomicrobiota bacterium]